MNLYHANDMPLIYNLLASLSSDNISQSNNFKPMLQQMKRQKKRKRPPTTGIDHSLEIMKLFRVQ